MAILDLISRVKIVPIVRKILLYRVRYRWYVARQEELRNAHLTPCLSNRAFYGLAEFMTALWIGSASCPIQQPRNNTFIFLEGWTWNKLTDNPAFQQVFCPTKLAIIAFTFNFPSICPTHHARLFECKFTTRSKFSWEQLPNFLCHHPGKTAMCCLQLLGAPGDRMDLEITHNQKSFYSKVLSQNNRVFSRSLTFPIPNYVTP